MVTLFRKILFWIHLAAGLVAGIIIAVMSLTGAILVFDQEAQAMAENGQRIVEVGESRLSVDELVAKAKAIEGEAKASGITLYAEPERSVKVNLGRREYVYLNPYTGELLQPEGKQVGEFMQLAMRWHRWLAMDGEGRDVGKAITGACNLAFVVLIITGFYLWWPRRWTAKVLAGQFWFRKGLKAKARDFNWHNVLGFWSALPLLIFSVTAVYWSYDWGREGFFNLTGPAPEAPALTVELDRSLPKQAEWSRFVEAAQATVPTWKELQLTWGGTGRGPGGGQGAGAGQGQGQGERRMDGTGSGPRPEGPRPEGGAGGGQGRGEAPTGPQPIKLSVRDAKTFFPQSASELYLHPQTAEVLLYRAAEDLPLATKIRVSIKGIHTARAGGIIGQIIGVLTCLAAVVLCWTGFALSWRRFFGGKGKARKAKNEEAPVTDSPVVTANESQSKS